MNPHLLLDRATVEGRLQDFTRGSYFYIYGMTKNVALGIAAFVVITFVRDPSTFAPRLAFWLASISVIVVTHATAARGVLLAGFRYTWLDTVIPLSMGLLECLLFTVLQPNKEEPRLWLFWYVLLFIHMLLAVGLVLNRLHLLKVKDFEDSLRPLASTCRSWLWNDVIGAALCATVVLLLGSALHFWVLPRSPRSEWWQVAFGLLVLGMMCGVVAKAETERNKIIAFVRRLPNT